MEINNRTNIRKLINEIEINYPVNEWMHNGYHVWPILRINLYLTLTKKYENNRNYKDNVTSSYNKAIDAIRATPDSISSLINLSSDVDAIYCGAPSYRVNYRGKSLNRYFDHLMDKEVKDTLLLERDSDTKKNYYKPERVLLISTLYSWYNIFTRVFHKSNKEDNLTEKLLDTFSSLDVTSKEFVSSIPTYISNMDKYVSFYVKILKKINPKKIYILCYYSSSILGLNIAAHRLGIKTIDMQHGPQGEYHLAYGSWNNIPEEGYEALPDEFHTWDESSANIIGQWARNTTKHSAIVTGNPWLEGWKKGVFGTNNYQWPNNLILYTLQPIGNPLELYLLETIKRTSDQWNWWLRLHPRQMGELKVLESKLSDFGILDKVNIDDATKRLLPEILMQTKVHLTKFSGCAFEAYQFDVPTIILDNRGENIFKDYFEHHLMSICTTQNVNHLIEKIEKKLT